MEVSKWVYLLANWTATWKPQILEQKTNATLLHIYKNIKISVK